MSDTQVYEPLIRALLAMIGLAPKLGSLEWEFPLNFPVESILEVWGRISPKINSGGLGENLAKSGPRPPKQYGSYATTPTSSETSYFEKFRCVLEWPVGSGFRVRREAHRLLGRSSPGVGVIQETKGSAFRTGTFRHK